MNYKNISRGLALSLAISFAGCASDGNQGKQPSNTDGSQQTSDLNSNEGNETNPNGASFDWEFTTRGEDGAAPQGTFGLSFHLDSLFNHPDYDMPINNYSYEELRVLRSIPYARLGHWFKEVDLFEKFNGIKEYVESLEPIAKNYAMDQIKNEESEYWRLWRTNYPKTYSLFKLDAKEAVFVKRVDAEIAKLEEKRYVEKEGLKLLNLDLAENTNYLRCPSSEAINLLRENNFCISETRAEQMYNPYEYYHNLPHYITTDLFLAAYNAYLVWELQCEEEENIHPLMSKFTSEMYYQSLEDLESCSDKAIRPLAEHAVVYYAIASYLFSGEECKNLPDGLRDIYGQEKQAIESESDGPSALLKSPMPYSLFKPRSFYTRNENTKKYFKGMMWLQSAKYRIEKDEAIVYPLFLALQYERLDPSTKQNMEKVNNLLTFLIGEVDNCSIMDISAKLAPDFGIKSDADLKDPQKLASARSYLEKENSRCNRLYNRVESSKPVAEINFMPQRYTPDAEVLMWMCDIRKESGRPFPDGLDVLNAFGNTVAENLLNNTDPGTKKWAEYASTSAKMKSKFKNYPDFNKSIYNKSIEALVALQNKGIQPDYMKTKAWQMKNTNTALASWAELKHNTILYAEQPGEAEGGEGGERIYMPEPEWYSDIVEPNLAFWRKAIELLELNGKVLAENKIKNNSENDSRNNSETFWKGNWLLNNAKKFLEITQKELAGTPVHEKLNVDTNFEDFCNHLFFKDGTKINNTDIAKIADIYTREIHNGPDNGILHTGLGLVNSIYVLVENNGHIYLTEGAVYDYRLTVLGERLNDDEWRKKLNENYSLGRPKWMEPYILKDNNRVRILQNVGERSLRGWEFEEEPQENSGWFTH